MTSKTFLVAQREYVESIRTKTFWLGILAFPVIIVIAIFIAWLMQQTKETRVYTVADFTASQIGGEVEAAARAQILVDILKSELGAVLPADHEAIRQLEEVSSDMVERGLALMPAEVRTQLQAKVAERKEKYRYRSLRDLGITAADRQDVKARLNELVRQDELFAYFVFDGEPVKKLDGLAYVSENKTDPELQRWYSNAATTVVQGKRIRAANIDKDTARHLRERVRFEAEQPGQGAETETVDDTDQIRAMAPIGFVYFLWIAVFTAAQMLLTNTVEEKSNRIIEVLLSSVSPGQLMVGKILGIGATGLTMVISWAVCALLGVYFGGLAVPKIAELNLLGVVGDPIYLAQFIAYFLSGYLLFAAVLVALGSVCNSLKEAQNLQQPVFILLMIPIFAMLPVVQEPNGLMAKVFTYIPIYTPFAMMNRASGPPAPIEYVITTVLILFSLWFTFKAAGKVFRIGVLMTGNPPKLKEILGWLRAK